MKKIGAIILTLAMLFSIIPQVLAADYAYEISEVYFTDLVGTVLEKPGRSCMVNVKVTKLTDRLGEDDMVIASYATDGTMIGFTALGGTMDKGETSTFKTLVSAPAGKDIGVIKTYVWNNISEMKPLSLVSQTVINEMDEGVYLPPVNEDLGGENYVPSTITVRGTITETPVSYGLENGTYRVSNLYIPDDPAAFDGVYEEEDYEALRARLAAASIAYGIPLESEGALQNTVKVISDIDLCDYLFYDMEFEIKMENDEYIVITAEPCEENGNILCLAAEDYIEQSLLPDSTQYSTTNSKIRFGSTYYTLERYYDDFLMTFRGPAIYINGIQKAEITPEADVSSGLTASQATLDNYLSNARGTVKLIDNNTTPGYEAIFIEIWNVAKVLVAENYDGRTNIVMTTKNAIPGATAYDEIVIDDECLEDGNTVVSVEKNGEAATLASIAKGDIIAYKSDINDGTGTDLDNPIKIDIIATNDKVKGTVTGIDTGNETITIDGTVYSATKWGSVGTTLVLANSYILTLDPFGRIYEAEIDGSTATLAIALGITSDEESIKLLLADGTTKTYPISSNATIAGFDAGLSINAASNGIIAVRNYLNNASLEADKRVVEYKVKNSTGEVTQITRQTSYKDYAWANGSEGKYNERTSMLGSTKITAETNVIDATKATWEWNSASGYSKFDVAKFEDGTKYKYVSFCAPGSSYIALVVIKEGGLAINKNSRFAVLRGNPTLTVTEEGDMVYAVTVLHEGESEKVLNFYDHPANAPYNLARGDAFFYEVDNYDIVTDAFKIVEASSKTFTTLADALAEKYKNSYISTVATDDESWGFSLVNEEGHKIQLVEGYVIPSFDGAMAFARAVTPLTRIDLTMDLALVDTDYDGVGDTYNDGIAIFAVADDTEAYLYDMSNSEIINAYDKFSVKADTALLASTGLARYESDGVYYNDGNDMSERANYAVAMIVDEVIETVYVIK